MLSLRSLWQLLLLIPLGIEVNAKPVGASPSLRPTFKFSPQGPWKPFPVSPQREKYCYVQSHHNGGDDSNFILSALHKCNYGGHVVFSKDTTYTIGTALDLTFLEHVDLDIQGKITFTNDTNYWQEHSFKFAYQNSSSYFQIGGIDVNVFGGGIIDGNGQTWWDLFASNSLIYRPILFVINGLKGGSVSDITLYNSPMWNNFVTGSENIIYDNVIMNATSDDKNFISNTDGWDIFKSDNVVLQNCQINNGDDCVSFKPNSTNILVQNLWCNGSHGISVGSLGQYVGEVDIVENVKVYNISMNNASDGARIKVWPGASTSSTSSGGGSGYVKNILYDGMHNNNNQWAIEVTQCYGVSNTSVCADFPAELTISDVIFRNFDGTTSKSHEPYVATVVCSSPNVCSNITAANFNVVSPEGTNQAVCTNINTATLGLNCTSG